VLKPPRRATGGHQPHGHAGMHLQLQMAYIDVVLSYVCLLSRELLGSTCQSHGPWCTDVAAGCVLGLNVIWHELHRAVRMQVAV
jgi:hypothetical protein